MISLLYALAVVVSILEFQGANSNSCPHGEISCGGNSTHCYPKSYHCDGQVDCENTYEDEKDCETHVCEEGQFQCDIGNCIDGDRRCDAAVDCNDSSDEKGCVYECDELRQFKCRQSGKCILHEQRCDGLNDCGDDYSDETNCDGECEDRQFHCYNQAEDSCIDSKWRCDGEEDCNFGEDEENCPIRKPNCEDGMLCDSNTRCVRLSQRCDNFRDCADGSDEAPELCATHCAPNQWQCFGPQIGQCIEAEFICDSHNDCLDGSDEQDCSGLRPRPCSSEEFLCPNGACLPPDWRCDGMNDCKDANGGSDEANCDACGIDEFQCPNSTCISRSEVCDGSPNCPEGTDELHCLAAGETCTKGFKCSNTDKCIPKQLLCNKVDDCGDWSDEVEDCEPWDSCSENNGGCEHECISRANSGHICTCHAGYMLAENGTNCTDINECRTDQLTCSQFCNNTESSFRCYCDEGYVLAENNVSCIAQDSTEAYIVFSNLRQMRKASLSGRVGETLFQTNDSNIIDFNYRDQTWVWVSHLSKKTSDKKRDYKNVVQQRFFNNSGVRTVFSAEDLEIVNMALDWITGAIYLAAYTSITKKSTISVVVDEGTVLPVVHASVDRVVSLALDPRDRLLFWTDIDRTREGQIGRSYMDGSKPTVLARNVGRANGIAVDYARRILVWIDAGSGSEGGRLEEMTYTGSGRRVVKLLQPDNAKPWSVTLFQDFYYWTDSHTSKEALVKCNRFDTSEVTLIRMGLKTPMAVKVVHPLRQPLASNPCSSANCSHVCLLSKEGAACRCPKDLILRDGWECVARTFEAVCPTCPKGSPCVRVSGSKYDCVTKVPAKTTPGPSEAPSHRVGPISWWLILIIVILLLTIILIGIISCMKTFKNSCESCVGRVSEQAVRRQDYTQISLQGTRTITIDDSGAENCMKKESDI